MKSTKLENAIANVNKSIKKCILDGYTHSAERENEKLNKLLHVRDVVSQVTYDLDIDELLGKYASDIQDSYFHSAERNLEKIMKMIEVEVSMNPTSTKSVSSERGIKILVDGKEITINQLVAGLANNPATKNSAMEISMAVMTGKVESILDSIRAEM